MELVLDAGSTPAVSTRTRSVELYSFSRMSSRLSINSRVANSSPRFFCLQERQDSRTKIERVPHGAAAPLDTRRRRAGHREKARMHALPSQSRALATSTG